LKFIKASGIIIKFYVICGIKKNFKKQLSKIHIMEKNLVTGAAGFIESHLSTSMFVKGGIKRFVDWYRGYSFL